MQAGELKVWRQKFGLTQESAAKVFGVTRVTEQNWEGGSTPVPRWVDDRREIYEALLRRQPEFGPVILHYCDGPSWGHTTSLPHKEQFPNNEAAIRYCCAHWRAPAFQSPFIMDDKGNHVWPGALLTQEIERRLTQMSMTSKSNGLAERLMEIGRHFSALPAADPDFSADDLYDEDGLPK